MHFQWYPGHMTKARRQMQEDIKLIDLVIFQSSNLDNEQLSECLLQFPIPYSNIARLNKVPKLPINDQNNKLKQFLEERNLEYISSITKTRDNKYYKVNKKQNI